MKKIKFLSIVLILFSGIILSFFACQKEVENDNIETENAKYFVSIEKIDEVLSYRKGLNKYIENIGAEEFHYKDSSEDNYQIEDYIEINDQNGEVALYLTKLSNNTLVTFAADNRSHPIMSYSEFDDELDIKSLPPNFIFWLYDEAMAIGFARENNVKQTEEINVEWQSITVRNEPPIGGNPWECPNAYYYEKSPILTTTWGQGNGYNNLCPNLGCAGNGHAPTGCVATAMAQIMNYHEHPSNYNWSNMPDNSGTIETQSLMSDARVSVNMDYDCDGSGAYSWKVDDALEDDFNYSNASYGSFNHNTVKSNLNQNRPVYLSGDRISGYFLGIPLYTGHAWVCDGYRASHICVFDENGNIIGEYDLLSFHMNWGWNSNGSWCGVNNFTAPNGHAYNYHKKMVYNIIP